MQTFMNLLYSHIEKVFYPLSHSNHTMLVGIIANSFFTRIVFASICVTDYSKILIGFDKVVRLFCLSANAHTNKYRPSYILRLFCALNLLVKRSV